MMISLMNSLVIMFFLVTVLTMDTWKSCSLWWGVLCFAASKWHGLGLALTWKRQWCSKIILRRLFVSPLMHVFVLMTWFHVLRFWIRLICIQGKCAYKIGVLLDILLCYYGVDHSRRSFKFPPLVNQTTCKHEFLIFKLQCTTQWGE